MKPGLQVNDYIFVKKFAYGYNNSSLANKLNIFNLFDKTLFFNNPKGGDVVVFLLPSDSNIAYTKRLIGLPEDKIQMREGNLYINGTAVQKVYKGQKINISNNGMTRINNVFEEILPNGVQYMIYTEDFKKIYHSEEFDHNNTPIYEVPHDHYFFMGDNRDGSLDSRFIKRVGYVNKNRIIGKIDYLSNASVVFDL